jgi:hypothetical protein
VVPVSHLPYLTFFCPLYSDLELSVTAAFRFCDETKRGPLELMKEDLPSIQTQFNSIQTQFNSIQTQFNFWDYTITKCRKRFDAVSTLQTYYNEWTLIRRQKTGLSNPDPFKDAMTGVRPGLG